MEGWATCFESFSNPVSAEISSEDNKDLVMIAAIHYLHETKHCGIQVKYFKKRKNFYVV